MLAAWLSAPPVLAADGQEDLRVAVSAFRNNDLHRALYYFQRALDAGVEGSRIHYNLGVVHYRLGQYVLAYDYFLNAARYPESRQIAHYNLARSAERAGWVERAAEWYQRAIEGDEERIASLARQARRQLLAGREPAFAWSTLSAVGFDSAVVGLVDQVTSEPTDSPDTFLELAASVSARERAFHGGEFSWQAGGYLLGHDTVKQADVASLNAQGRWTTELGQGRLGLRGRVAQEWLNQEPFQLRGAAAVDFSHVGFDGIWRHVLNVERLSARSAAPDGIDGWRVDGRTDWLRLLGGQLLRSQLFGEWNDRRDDINSPYRYGGEVSLRSSRLGPWRLRPGLQWRESRFPDDVLPEERRWRASLGLEQDLQGGWSVVTELLWEENRSDLPSRDYQHLRLAFSLFWQQ